MAQRIKLNPCRICSNDVRLYSKQDNYNSKKVLVSITCYTCKVSVSYKSVWWNKTEDAFLEVSKMWNKANRKKVARESILQVQTK